MCDKKDVIRLRHMREAALEAVAFIQDETRTSLDDDRKLTLALIREIEIIGEAAARISQEYKNNNPQIPWHAIVGMRNRLIHAYFDIDLDQVWSAATKDLPPLIAQLEQIIPPEGET